MPELNGQYGTIDGWDEAQNRWRVIMDDGSGKLLKRCKLKVLTALDEFSQPGCGGLFSEEEGKNFENQATGGFATDCQSKNSGSGVSGPVFSLWQQVRVADCVARPELNGKVGWVLGYDPAKQRWKVRLEDDDRNARLFHASTLEPSMSVDGTPRPAPVSTSTASKPIRPGSRVRIIGIENQPGIPWLKGTAVAFSQNKKQVTGMWEVRLDDGRIKFLVPGDLELLDGQCDDSGGLAGEASEAPTAAAGPTTGTQSAPSPTATISPPPATATASSCTTFAIGQRIRVISLRSQTQHNGEEGRIVGFDEREVRWKVRMDEGSRLLLKAQNIEALDVSAHMCGACGGDPLKPGSRVRVRGLVMRPEMNGHTGSLVGFDEAEGRWRVRMDDGSGKTLRVEHLQAIDGIVQAVDAAVQAMTDEAVPTPNCELAFAGLEGLTIMGYISSKKLWRVRLKDGTDKLMTDEDLEAWEQASEAPATTGTASRKAAPGGSAAETRRVRQQQRRQHLASLKATAAAAQKTPIKDTPPPSGTSTRAVASPSGGTDATATGTGARFLAWQRVLVVGLHELDGLEGTVEDFDEVENRWKIRMDDSALESLRAANLKPISGPGAEPVEIKAPEPPPAPSPPTPPPPTLVDQGVQAVPEGPTKEEKAAQAAAQAKAAAEAAKAEAAKAEAAKAAAEAAKTAAEAKAAAEARAAANAKIAHEAKLAAAEAKATAMEAKADVEAKRAVQAKLAGEAKLARAEAKATQNQKALKAAVEAAEAAAAAEKAEKAAVEMRAAKKESITVSYTPGARFRMNSEEWIVEDYNQAQGYLKVRLPNAPGADVPKAVEVSPSVDKSDGNESGNAGSVVSPTKGAMAPGSRVVVSDEAKIVAYDEITGCWRVRMDDGSERLMRRDQVQPLTASEAVDALRNAVRAKGSAGASDGASVAGSDGEHRANVVAEAEATAKAAATAVEKFCNDAAAASDNWRASTVDGELATASPGRSPLPQAAAFEGFESGQRIIVVGLVTRSDLNGLRGKVLGYDENEGRWKVRLDKDGGGRLLKAKNIFPTQEVIPASDDEIRLDGPAPWADEDEGDAAEPHLSRWQQPHCTENSRRGARTTPSGASSSMFVPGQHIFLVNLETRGDLNGVFGLIEEYSPHMDRWKVRMFETDELLLMNASNIRAVPTPSDAAATVVGSVGSAASRGVTL
eukprot:TRINITY_DN12068_c0_g1_i1.p1 TRINITY_DN12068_c0_g1~~TRINITY_DN12068_c0_g1_i1.p1  ORF type:complete len:1395 (+),score=291.46 TRINITY_DN12068_c0_g1_i1:614-4186(+)